MRLAFQRSEPRRGAIAILVALMVICFMAFVALAVDVGYIAMVHTEMQNAADAAALAGASQLVDQAALSGVPTGSPDTAMANARTQAQALVHLNPTGTIMPVLDANTTNAAGGDIVCGYIADPKDRSTPMTRTIPGTGPYPNACQVTLHLDATRNGPVGLFFARFMGQNSQSLQVKSTGIYQAQVQGFKVSAPGYSTIKLLPFALDQTTWNNVVNGTGSDNFSRNKTTGAITAGSDGITECKLFPLSNGNGNGNGNGSSGLPPGNFGTVDIGSPNNSTADLSRQIRYGPNATDLSYFPNSTIRLDPVTHTLTLQGDTGVSAGVKDDLAAIIGQPRIIPIYSSVSGPGNNARYTIVAFGGIVITEVELTGSLSSKHITIQPCFVVEPNAVAGSSSSSTSYFVVKPLALSY